MPPFVTRVPNTPPSLSRPPAHRQKKLVKLADGYILGSNGKINVVLGFDIERHGHSKRATVSVWRPRIVSDPEDEAGILEMDDIREADVIPPSPPRSSFSSLINPAFDSRFEPMTVPRFKAMN